MFEPFAATKMAAVAENTARKRTMIVSGKGMGPAAASKRVVECLNSQIEFGTQVAEHAHWSQDDPDPRIG